jgi:hypothetical protein
MNVSTIVAGFVAILFGGFLVALFCAAFTMLLWNWLLPDLFNLPVIGFWQAVGITLLANLLFKSYPTNSK